MRAESIYKRLSRQRAAFAANGVGECREPMKSLRERHSPEGCASCDEEAAFIKLADSVMLRNGKIRNEDVREMNASGYIP